MKVKNSLSSCLLSDIKQDKWHFMKVKVILLFFVILQQFRSESSLAMELKVLSVKPQSGTLTSSS